MRRQVLIGVVLVALAVVANAVDLRHTPAASASKTTKKKPLTHNEGKTKADLEVKVKKANEEELKYQRGQIAHQQNVWQANQQYQRLLARTNTQVAKMQAAVAEVKAQLLKKSAQSSFVKDAIAKINQLHKDLAKIRIHHSAHTASVAKLAVLQRQAKRKLAAAERELSSIRLVHGLEQQEAGEQKTRDTVKKLHLQNQQELLKLKQQHRAKEIAESKKNQKIIQSEIAADKAAWNKDLDAARKRAAARTAKMQAEFTKTNAADAKRLKQLLEATKEETTLITSGEAAVKKGHIEKHQKHMAVQKEKGQKEAAVKNKAEKRRKAAREKRQKKAAAARRERVGKKAEKRRKKEVKHKQQLAAANLKAKVAAVKEKSHKEQLREVKRKAWQMSKLKAKFAAAAAAAKAESTKAKKAAAASAAKAQKQMAKAVALAQKVAKEHAKNMALVEKHKEQLRLAKLAQKREQQKREKGYKHLMHDYRAKVRAARARDRRERKRKNHLIERLQKRAKAHEHAARALHHKHGREVAFKKAHQVRLYIDRLAHQIKALRVAAKAKSQQLLAEAKKKVKAMNEQFKAEHAKKRAAMEEQTSAAMTASHAQVQNITAAKNAAIKAQKEKDEAHLTKLRAQYSEKKNYNITGQLVAHTAKVKAENAKFAADLACLTHKMQHAHPHTKTCYVPCSCIKKVVQSNASDVTAIRAKYAARIKELEKTHKATLASLAKERKAILAKKTAAEEAAKAIAAKIIMYKVQAKAQLEALHSKFQDKLQKVAADLEAKTFALQHKHAVEEHKAERAHAKAVAHVVAEARRAVHKSKLETASAISKLELKMRNPPSHVTHVGNTNLDHHQHTTTTATKTSTTQHKTTKQSTTSQHKATTTQKATTHQKATTSTTQHH